jgi:hypothetical protein
MPASSVDKSRRRRWQARGDIMPVSRPGSPPQQWRDQAEALDQLRDWAEARTVETIIWYLRDKRGKRWESRLLRAAAVVFAVAGGVLPLVSGSTEGINPNLGYIFLAVAAGCVAFDHFFGLSSGWMRDVAALEALQGRLARFHMHWAKWQAARAGALDGGTAASAAADAGADDAAAGVAAAGVAAAGVAAATASAATGTTGAALDLIEGLIIDVTQVTEAETTQWIAEFTSSVAALRQQAVPSVTSPQDLITWSSRGDLSSS